MRRLIGPILVGTGVFLIVAAALVRFYAMPTLTMVPSGYNSVTHLEAIGAEIFNSDPEVLAAETHDLVITSNTREDADADAPDGVVVWVNATRSTRPTAATSRSRPSGSPSTTPPARASTATAATPGSPSPTARRRGAAHDVRGTDLQVPVRHPEEDLRRLGRLDGRGHPRRRTRARTRSRASTSTSSSRSSSRRSSSSATSPARSSGRTSRLSRRT